VDDLWAMKSEDVWLIVCASSFQDFQPMWSWSTNVTDRQTDDMRSQDRALHYSASRGKNWVVDAGMVICLGCRFAYGPADATATHCLLLQ